MFFDRVAVVNLDRRPERWEAFCDRLPQPWPLPECERFPAIDGLKCCVPTKWRSGPGAYGCLLSHLTLWRQARDRRETLLVLEDDATFCDGFADRLKAFCFNAPTDWQMLYLGGKHVMPVERTNDNSVVVRCNGVKKTHAYAIRGRILDYLIPILDTRAEYHVDVELSILHHNFRVYAPKPWLCGQAAGVSDILSGSAGEPERWFQEVA